MEHEDRTRALEALSILQGLLIGEPACPASTSVTRRRGLFSQTAQTTLSLHQLRRDIFGAELASEHSWEIMLTLYVAWSQGSRISVTDLAHETGIATATVVRWLAVLANSQMVARAADPNDGRRTWISLTKAAIEKIEHFLGAQIFRDQGTNLRIHQAA
ncbi:MarR family transcriptional regulator [Novosphingobium sp. SL115]|uniref:MarR family transcriptional regulator n=1 Tax=Novosphingobium sp. SL115 TaxID=2995150 RepID=UPI0022752977|nr:MarR family transcriptional regulator [Novosphingobium sp. SL115]MCY1669465.1 MarR family transcriptional regulator [Novosphingobium sp. SL115]